MEFELLVQMGQLFHFEPLAAELVGLVTYLDIVHVGWQSGHFKFDGFDFSMEIFLGKDNRLKELYIMLNSFM